jgi:hypothetical protein
LSSPCREPFAVRRPPSAVRRFSTAIFSEMQKAVGLKICKQVDSDLADVVTKPDF